MSYIRATNNPEGLYIINSTRNRVEFIIGVTFYCMPTEVFHTLVKMYDRLDGLDVKYQGASITEIYKENDKKPSPIEEIMDTTPGDFQIRLAYEDWHIDIWHTTWYYIVVSVLKELHILKYEKGFK